MSLTIYALDDEGTLQEIELSPEHRDALEAWAYLESWSTKEAVEQWLAWEAVDAGRHHEIVELIRLRTQHRANKRPVPADSAAEER